MQFHQLYNLQRFCIPQHSFSAHQDVLSIQSIIEINTDKTSALENYHIPVFDQAFLYHTLPDHKRSPMQPAR